MHRCPNGHFFVCKRIKGNRRWDANACPLCGWYNGELGEFVLRLEQEKPSEEEICIDYIRTLDVSQNLLNRLIVLETFASSRNYILPYEMYLLDAVLKVANLITGDWSASPVLFDQIATQTGGYSYLQETVPAETRNSPIIHGYLPCTGYEYYCCSQYERVEDTWEEFMAAGSKRMPSNIIIAGQPFILFTCLCPFDGSRFRNVDADRVGWLIAYLKQQGIKPTIALMQEHKIDIELLKVLWLVEFGSTFSAFAGLEFL